MQDAKKSYNVVKKLKGRKNISQKEFDSLLKVLGLSVVKTAKEYRPGIKFSLETAKYGGKGAMYARVRGVVPVIWMIKRRKRKAKKK